MAGAVSSMLPGLTPETCLPRVRPSGRSPVPAHRTGWAARAYSSEGKIGRAPSGPVPRRQPLGLRSRGQIGGRSCARCWSLVCSLSSSPSRLGVGPALSKRKAVEVDDNYFVRAGAARTVTVDRNDTVVWAWEGRNPHNVTVTRALPRARSARAAIGRSSPGAAATRSSARSTRRACG